MASNQSVTFRPDIEGLRAIAVLLVVAFHCHVPGTTGGFVGVDVFFALSGYLITGLLATEIQKTSKLDLLAFYARRVRRLLPASVLVLLVTLLVGSVLLAPQELGFAARAGRASALYMSNIFFAVNAADYFAPDVATNPMLHTWSLAVEEQFYLFWPPLILAGLQFRKSRIALVMLLTALTAISLAACVWLTETQTTFAFYNLPTRAWEFGIGGLAALLTPGTTRLPRSAWTLISWLGLAATVGSAYFISEELPFPGWVALAPVLGTVATLIAAAEQPSSGAVALLRAPPLQWLGKLSYSWYLWHWPLLMFAAALVPGISWIGKVAAATIALALAVITHHVVENPIRFHPALLRRPALTLSLGLVLTLSGFAAAFLSIHLASRLADAPEMRAITRAVTDIADMPRQRCVSLGTSRDVVTCDFGDPSSATTLVLFGDSHAIQWFNPLKRIATTRAWKMTTFVKSGCPATDISASDSCMRWRADALRQIIALRPAIVVLGNANGYIAGRNGFGIASSVSLDDWRDATRRTLTTLANAGLRVAAIRDTPIASFDIPTCLARSVRLSWRSASVCDIDRSTALDPAVFEAERAGAGKLANVHFLDLTDRFCAGDTCAAVQGDQMVYRDNNHITGSFANSLAPVLEAALLPLLDAATATH
jgi:peptidoglycan/LPS O-acetylase OafA/YrhL